jgi:hypothetical protein
MRNRNPHQRKPELFFARDALAHRTDPKGHVSENRGHFSLTRPSGSVPTDAPLKELSIGLIPKVVSTFGSDACLMIFPS